MAPRPPLPPGPFLLVGLARSGGPPVLRALGEEVIGCDNSPVGRRRVAAPLRAVGAAVHDSTDGLELLDGVATVVRAPGVPLDAPVVRAACRHGMAVLGELELGWLLVPNELIAITGSNGKTTTTAMARRLLQAAGRDAEAAGNIGRRSAR